MATAKHISTTCIQAFLLIILLVGSSAAIAEFSDEQNAALLFHQSHHKSTHKVAMTFDAKTAVKHLYVGQAKIAGQYGVGLLMKTPAGVVGFTHRGLAFLKRF